MSELIFKQHVSQEDLSVNFEHRFTDHQGMLEARYVRRTDEYFIVYLSSQTGCKQACRMCWLTATGQNDTQDVTVEQYLQQAREVLGYYKSQVAEGVTKAERVHFNFMARGEPLANPIFREHADEIFRGLRDLALELGLTSKFLVSTIFPKVAEGYTFVEMFKDPEVYPEIYYSLYSMDESFRKRWLPRATHPYHALGNLRSWQMATGKTPKIHFAFIQNENDNVREFAKMCERIDQFRLKLNWNIVRYNPPTGHWSSESPITRIVYLSGFLKSRYPESKIKVVSRVGLDVMASCGTFLK